MNTDTVKINLEISPEAAAYLEELLEGKKRVMNGVVLPVLEQVKAARARTQTSEALA